MKKTKLWMPLVAIATTGATMLPLVSLASCGVKVDVKVTTYADLKEALANEDYKKIGLDANIPVTPENGALSGLEITRPVEIYGNGYEICWTDTESTTADKKHSLFDIAIDNQTPTQMEVLFNNVQLTIKTRASANAVVCASNIQHCKVTFDGCKVTSVKENEYRRYYGLFILPTNKQDSDIVIKNSTFDAWGAIYNQGSNVTLRATDSTFVGTNDYGETDTFATIVASDYPMATTVNPNRSFSANNDFDFYNCVLQAKSSTEGIISNLHQFIIENRSAAHNIVSVSSNSTCNCPFKAEAWFITVDEDAGYAVTNDHIAAYCATAAGNPDVPEELLDKTSINDYYGYYGHNSDEETNHSYINIMNEVVSSYNTHKNMTSAGVWDFEA